ncbi:MAG TPA: oxaloacetate decarboxylase subunit alpha, partial [Lachnospiraceae bacterium]|nr:oxaloacetate decarboxylase subunit alpha [Lachnospiraceae bacterium]
PGGMLSNMISQLKDQGASDRLTEVLEEVPRVREDLGEPPLVTPSSQIVGTQAVMNVLMGERYKISTDQTKNFVRGKYGRTIRPMNPDVVKKIIGDEKQITCRPADLIPPQMDKYREDAKKVGAKSEEDVLSYALFPQVATDFFKWREAQETGNDATKADKANGAYPA